MTWRPLVEGEAARTARQVARAIGEALVAAEPADPSLAGGAAGLALLLCELDEAFPGAGFADAAAQKLERAAEALATEDLGPGLYHGFTGIVWAHARLTDGLDAGEIDDAVAELLSTTPWPGSFDLVGGLVGYVVYAHERRSRPCLERALERIEELSRRPEGLLVPPEQLAPRARAAFPEGCWDFGLAHGVPGVLAAVALLDEAAVAPERTRTLLVSLVDWLLARRDPDGSFPSRRLPTGQAFPARTAWCYGDPGVAASLHFAGRLSGRDDWQEVALALARRAAPREDGVTDANLCHGAAGLLHLWNRMYQASGDPELAVAARRWFDRTLALRGPSGIGGFEFDRASITGEPGRGPEPGLLMGSAGVALALLAAASPVEPGWDRMLLVA